MSHIPALTFSPKAQAKCNHIWNEWTQEIPVLFQAESWLRQCAVCQKIESQEGEVPE